MMTPTDFHDGDTFRFSRLGQGTYKAMRQDSFWHVTLEGNTDRWMLWLFSDETVLKDFWDSRLTD